MEELQRQAQEAIDASQAALNSAAEIQKKLDSAEALPDPVDTTALRTKIAAAQATNTHVRDAQRRAAHLAKAEESEKRSAELTAAMEKRNEEKRAAVAAANLPIPGLSLGEGEALLNELPLSQASTREQLRTGVAIVAALRPKLRVALVREGSLLDDDGLMELAGIAAEHDLQVWVERVDTSGEVGFVIEDGQLAHSPADEEPTADEAA